MLRDALGGFLVLTLVATALAKARRPRATAHLIARSVDAPPAVGAVLLVAVCAAELGLAALVCLDPASIPTGAPLALLFIAFAAHHLVVRVRSGSTSCGCAGPSRPRTSRPGEAAGRSAAAVLLATLSLVWAACPRHDVVPVSWLPWVGFVVPLAALAIGQLGARTPADRAGV